MPVNLRFAVAGALVAFLTAPSALAKPQPPPDDQVEPDEENSADDEAAVDEPADDKPADDEPAEDGIGSETKAAAHFLPSWVSVGAGFAGVVGANFLDKPSDQTIQGVPIEPEYPGFVGINTGFGPSFDVRFLGYIGFELDILFGSASGSADLSTTNLSTQEKSKFDVEIGHSATRVPLLLKGSVPGEYVQPTLFIGPEFVIASDATAQETRVSGSQDLSFNVGAVADSYTMLTFGLGMEFLLPIPKVDIRIPLTLRGSFTPSVADTRDERSEATLNGMQNALVEENYRTDWRFQAGVQFGAAWHF